MVGILLWLQHHVHMLQRREGGAAAVEYGLLVGLIAVVIILAVTFLGDTLEGMFDNVANKLGGSSTTTTDG